MIGDFVWQFFKWLSTVNIAGDQWNITAVILLLFCLAFATYKLMPLFEHFRLFFAASFAMLFVLTMLCISDASNWLTAPWATQPLKPLDILTVEFFGSISAILLVNIFKDVLRVTKITIVAAGFLLVIKMFVVIHIGSADYRLMQEPTATWYFIFFYIGAYIVLTVLFISIWKPNNRTLSEETWTDTDYIS